MKGKIKGFTLIEILMVMAIFALISTIAISTFSKVNQKEALEKDAFLTVSVLNEARSLTLASKDKSSYGVRFDSSSLTLFKGDTYVVGSGTNVVTNLNSKVGIGNISLSDGGSSVVFERLTGKVSTPGTVQLVYLSDSNQKKVVTITSTGISEITQ